MQQNWLAALTTSLSILFGCAEAGPDRGTPEWYWESAITSYAEGKFPDALEDLGYAEGGEGEFAARAGVLEGVLTAGLARANMEVAEACRAGIEQNADVLGLVGVPLQRIDRNVEQNIISFVEGLGDFQSAIGTGDVTLAFPFPPGTQTESSAMESVRNGEMISEAQLTDSIRDTQQLGVIKTVTKLAGLGENYAAAQAKFDGGPVTVPLGQFELTVAAFLVEMSGEFTQKKMNKPQIRDAVIQRAEKWIASGLESEDADIKKRAEDLKFDLENERRDMKGEKPLERR